LTDRLKRGIALKQNSPDLKVKEGRREVASEKILCVKATGCFNEESPSDQALNKI